MQRQSDLSVLTQWLGVRTIIALSHAVPNPSLPRYEKEFDQVQDVFELQRNLNNAFAYDLVPSPTVITAALRAARRVNDFPTAVRIFEGRTTPRRNNGADKRPQKNMH